MSQNLKLTIIALFTLLLTAVGCESQSNEESPTGEDTVINCRVTMSVDMSVLSAYDDYEVTKSGADLYWRCKLAIYDAADATATSTPILEDIVYPELSSELMLDVDEIYTLQAKEYKVAVWIDAVRTKDNSDNYYTTENLGTVKIMEDYVGDELDKDAMAACDILDLTQFQNAWEGEYHLTLEAFHPFGQYEVITTDLIKAFSNYGLSVQDIVTKVYYNDYLTSSYNVLEQRLNDSKLGVSYNAQLVALTDSTAHITTDFVMVSSTEDEVSLQICFYDKEDNLLNTTAVSSIPIAVQKKTTVYGEFLTTSGDDTY